MKRGRAYRGLEAVIDSKLGRRQQDIPVVHPVIDVVPECFLQDPVHALSLPCSLMMVSCAYALPDTKLGTYCTKEGICELRVPISDKHFWPPMQLEDV